MTRSEPGGPGALAGKVAFITGAARGQGRSHAVRLASEGADIIAVDLCAQIASVPYPLASDADLAETARAVEATGARIVTTTADVRDRAALQDAFDSGVATLGPVEIVVANAGIAPMAARQEPELWRDILDVNLTGAFHTVEVAKPSMIENKRGGAIVLTSSTAGNNGVGGPTPGGLAYAASKHGVVGLMRCYANDLGRHSIRVNSVHPSGVDTPMVSSESSQRFLARDPVFSSSSLHVLPVALLEPDDVSRAVAWLVSAAARYVTGVLLPVDAGFSNRP